ncbi:hypothetical protein MY10362_006538 [Beauveria mimosiformis]
MAQAINIPRADEPAAEGLSNVPSEQDDRSVHDPAATPQPPALNWQLFPSSKAKDAIGSDLSTAAGGNEVSGSVNVRSSAVIHGQEQVQNGSGSVPSQQENPQTSPSSGAYIAKALEAAEVIDTQELPQHEAADHNDEEPILIHSSDDGGPLEETNENGTDTKSAIRKKKLRAPNHGRAIERDDASSNDNSVERPVVPSAGSRSVRTRSGSKAPKSGVSRSLNRRKPSVASEIVQLPDDDNANETTSAVGPAGAISPNGATENRESQSTSNFVEATDTSFRLGVAQPELIGGVRREEEDLTGAPGDADDTREADAGEDAGVSKLGHSDRLQAQNTSRSDNTRLETNSQDLGEGQTDEIADSDAEPDYEDAVSAIFEFSTQKRRTDVAFRHSSSDSEEARNGNISGHSCYHQPAHPKSDSGTAHGTAKGPAQARGPQIDIRSLTTGAGAPQVTSGKVAVDMSDTTQEVDWLSLTSFRGRAAMNTLQWRLSNATLLAIDLDEDKFLQYKITGLWNLTEDGELSLSVLTKMVIVFTLALLGIYYIGTAGRTHSDDITPHLALQRMHISQLHLDTDDTSWYSSSWFRLAAHHFPRPRRQPYILGVSLTSSASSLASKSLAPQRAATPTEPKQAKASNRSQLYRVKRYKVDR